MNTPNSPLRLLKQKRSSAQIDARSIEAQLTRLSNSAGTAGIRTNLFCIVGMFRDYIATLDEAIHNIEYLMPVSKPTLLLS
jgi:hypothetical protein